MLEFYLLFITAVTACVILYIIDEKSIRTKYARNTIDLCCFDLWDLDYFLCFDDFSLSMCYRYRRQINNSDFIFFAIGNNIHILKSPSAHVTYLVEGLKVLLL